MQIKRVKSINITVIKSNNYLNIPNFGLFFNK